MRIIRRRVFIASSRRYLTRTDISNLIPLTLREELRRSHFLFLGYSLRDWNLRVILHRIWGEQKLTYKSWAIQLHPDQLEQQFWMRRDVEILDHLDRGAARRAIEGPIQEYNRRLAADDPPYRIEPEAVDAILEQVQTGLVVLGELGRGVAETSNPRALDARVETPYLQLVMARVWARDTAESSRVLRLATLHDLGGADRIVKTHLDEVMKGLAEADQDVSC